jgi:hypothetical protein
MQRIVQHSNYIHLEKRTQNLQRNEWITFFDWLETGKPIREFLVKPPTLRHDAGGADYEAAFGRAGRRPVASIHRMLQRAKDSASIV